MAAYENCYWMSADGLKLHYRLYPGDPALPPVVCLPGLTRNARDYDALAARLAGRRQVIAVDFRGRGKSEHARDPMTYVPATYVADMQALLTERRIARFVAIGTSLGGSVAMLLAQAGHGVGGGATIAAALLNDVGPEVDPAGMSRIRGYVGKGSSCPTWMHAARSLADAHGDVYPDWQIEQWLAMAKRLYRLNSSGRIVLDYDLKIAEPLRTPGDDAGPDMWAALSALRDTPVLIVRGGRSDVLAQPVAERMVAALDEAELVTLPGVGHAPTLAEDVLHGPIDRLLERART
ncbi:pimeloyl-ACP methyl ester carboxylesterase [Sphingomonas insulae]|uniref:Alpha/beta hydrolase n=1 Tax=Sphingomonas insulae TaxID=424800 RepID=A0ABN1HRR7_9SPHN|nr:alpha/beta hydrolase [Sphingomonas insulae]NIJ29150.1 pimeloyl-ACP methyl ester carboxylesterase [Sphingomonas insulae]